MGYRADIWIKAEEPHTAKLKELLEPFGDNFEAEEKLYTRWTAKNIQWSVSDERVVALKAFFNQVEDNETDSFFGMIELGEDGSMEEYGDCLEVNMSLVSTVAW